VLRCDLGEQADPDRPLQPTTTVTRVNDNCPHRPFSTRRTSNTNDPGIHRPPRRAARAAATALASSLSRRAHAADCPAAEIARQTNHADVAEAIAKP
jgi:hypothetical protein